MRITPLILPILLLSACGTAPTTMDSMEHMDHSEGMTMSMQSAEERLDQSPRHQEWVDVRNGDRIVRTFVVYPQRTDKAPIVLLIHENRGLNAWARSMADQVAEAGYIAVAPDLLSDFDDTHAETADFAVESDATKAISSLDPAQVTTDLHAVIAWAKTIPSATQTIASAGFCWGGSQSFRLATTSSELDAALVFYGSGPTDAASYEKVSAPVFGFYGGADERVNATITSSEELMSKSDKQYDYVIYDDAGHAFMRLGEDPAGDPSNVAAREAAWERMKNILSTL
ncbi:MAG: dienelactone hydrolase family protein [Candidatus Peribacteraceae bacterium]